jgi:predicted permease
MIEIQEPPADITGSGERFILAKFVYSFGIIIFGLALGVARMLSLAPKKTGALFGCGSFTNIGAIGALVCFVFLGEAGFALLFIIDQI